jgi:hypothetical protein
MCRTLAFHAFVFKPKSIDWDAPARFDEFAHNGALDQI